MQVGRALAVAVLGTVTFMSPDLSRAAAETQGVQTQTGKPGITIRLDAIDAVPARLSPIIPTPILGATIMRAPIFVPHARIRWQEASAAGRAAFIDNETPWVLPAEPPPPVIDTPGVLQCVPYARMISGIGLRGDAWTWWDKAAGVYARGNHPEPGAVLSFPGIERMPLGHVAVVTHVLDARKILIDHANWPNAFVRHGAISRGIQVVDISPANDWTEVRVQFGNGGPLGSTYPAHGFIYGWSEAGVQIARPHFNLDYALWSPVAPSWRMFNPVAYLWAMPKALRPRSSFASVRAPNTAQLVRTAFARPALIIGPIGPAVGTTGAGASGLGNTLAVNRLSVGRGAKPGFGLDRFVMQ